MGGESTSKTASNTTNTSTNTTTLRDLGFTGAQGVDALGITATTVGGALNNLINGTVLATDASGARVSSLFSDVTRRLGDNASSAINRGYEFSTGVNQEATLIFDRTAARAENTLSNIINSTRDFTQRALNVSTGQATPIQVIPTATNTPVISEGNRNTGLYIAIAAVAAVLLLFKD